jgi:uncharacterized protein
MNKEKLLKMAKLLHERIDAAAVHVFGSAAKQRLRADSDVDLAVFTKAQLTPDDLLTLKAELSSIAGRDVDLVEFDRAPETLQAEILRHGKLVQSWDENTRLTQIMRAMSRYQRLNDERRPGLDLRLGKDGWKRLS